ncbi:hypothetical protein RBG61_11880 [Paludicola sp. MB14-C6]|uniref:hypothetical protein n=1 Tax=Paludihabitans sp. MB14-C6 TaxID=3070656 RepID=UPI0027DD26DF|nr:hypothetical protein [Paludicola sp. MB14-C6]WMJ22682.1 hypothetical protein RBG61_11880 [Paludicola sp. MB14-C6]
MTNDEKQLIYLEISNIQYNWIRQVANQYKQTKRLIMEYCIQYAKMNEESYLDLWSQVKGSSFNSIRINLNRAKLFLPEDTTNWLHVMRKRTACKSYCKVIDLCIMYARLNAREFSEFLRQHFQEK